MIFHCHVPPFFIFRYNSDGNPAHNTIEEIEASDNEESLYDNVPKRNSGSKKFRRRSRGQTDHLRPSPPSGSRKKRGSRKSSGGSTIDRVRYA